MLCHAVLRRQQLWCTNWWRCSAPTCHHNIQTHTDASSAFLASQIITSNPNTQTVGWLSTPRSPPCCNSRRPCLLRPCLLDDAAGLPAAPKGIGWHNNSNDRQPTIALHMVCSSAQHIAAHSAAMGPRLWPRHRDVLAAGLITGLLVVGVCTPPRCTHCIHPPQPQLDGGRNTLTMNTDRRRSTVSYWRPQAATWVTVP
jgi:hypothetical protein